MDFARQNSLVNNQHVNHFCVKQLPGPKKALSGPKKEEKINHFSPKVH